MVFNIMKKILVIFIVLLMSSICFCSTTKISDFPVTTNIYTFGVNGYDYLPIIQMDNNLGSSFQNYRISPANLVSSISTLNYALTANYAIKSGTSMTANYCSTANYALTSNYAITANYATNAFHALTADTANYSVVNVTNSVQLTANILTISGNAIKGTIDFTNANDTSPFTGKNSLQSISVTLNPVFIATLDGLKIKVDASGGTAILNSGIRIENMNGGGNSSYGFYVPSGAITNAGSFAYDFVGENSSYFNKINSTQINLSSNSTPNSVEGVMYYSQGTHKMYVYDGSIWHPLW